MIIVIKCKLKFFKKLFDNFKYLNQIFDNCKYLIQIFDNCKYLNQITTEAEFKEFETRLKYGWFHLKLYQMFQAGA